MNKVLVGLAVLVLLGAAVFFLARGSDSPGDAPPPATASTPPPPPRAEAEAPKAAPAAPAAAAKTAPPRRKESAAPAEPVAPAAPTLATLVLDTDVPGASVFVNREYVGTTPLRLDKLDPGTRQLKLTADGYDGIERTVELNAGENPLTLRFRQVRLNRRMAVNHKHGVGGCEGTLAASVDGLVYETTNKGDAFTLTYAQLDSFVVDYLEKNLRVKEKGGKTWNFTDKNAANADALFVFHREVEGARKKLAEGYTAVR